MSTKLPPDAGTVCVALELDAGFMADVFRREAASALRTLAKQVEREGAQLDSMIKHAAHLLLIVDAFEREWELREGDGAVERNGGDSPTPPPPPSREESIA